MAGGEEWVRELSAEIPWKIVEEVRRRLVADVAKDTDIPGFRRGKAPRTLLYHYYANEIRRFVLDEVAPQIILREAAQRRLQVAEGPWIEEEGFVCRDGEPVLVRATVEVFPDFELGEYRKLKVPYEESEVTEEIVDLRIEALRREHASYQTLEPRPIRDGDIVLANVVGSSGAGEPEIQAEESRLHVGRSPTPQPCSDALQGRSPGERVEFEVTYPEDAADEVLAGKTLAYEAEILSIVRLDLPDLDDEFAKDIDNSLESLEDLRSGIRNGLEQAAKSRAEETAKGELLRQLVAAHPMTLPKRYIQGRCARAVKEVLAEEADAESLQDPDAERERLLQITLDCWAIEEAAVRTNLILARIADVEGISVSPEEVEGAVLEYARAQRISPEEARKKLDEQGLVDAWRDQRRCDRALQLVFDEAQRVDPPAADGQADGELPEAGG